MKEHAGANTEWSVTCARVGFQLVTMHDGWVSVSQSSLQDRILVSQPKPKAKRK